MASKRPDWSPGNQEAKAPLIAPPRIVSFCRAHSLARHTFCSRDKNSKRGLSRLTGVTRNGDDERLVPAVAARSIEPEGTPAIAGSQMVSRVCRSPYQRHA